MVHHWGGEKKKIQRISLQTDRLTHNKSLTHSWDRGSVWYLAFQMVTSAFWKKGWMNTSGSIGFSHSAKCKQLALFQGLGGNRPCRRMPWYTEDDCSASQNTNKQRNDNEPSNWRSNSKRNMSTDFNHISQCIFHCWQVLPSFKGWRRSAFCGCSSPAGSATSAVCSGLPKGMADSEQGSPWSAWFYFSLEGRAEQMLWLSPHEKGESRRQFWGQRWKK